MFKPLCTSVAGCIDTLHVAVAVLIEHGNLTFLTAFGADQVDSVPGKQVEGRNAAGTHDVALGIGGQGVKPPVPVCAAAI